MAVSLSWVVTCVFLTVSPADGFIEKGLRQRMLEKLELPEVPSLQRRDLENLVVPENVRNKYMSMLKRHRVKRRAMPSLAGILRGIPGDAGKFHIYFYMHGIYAEADVREGLLLLGLQQLPGIVGIMLQKQNIQEF